MRLISSRHALAASLAVVVFSLSSACWFLFDESWGNIGDTPDPLAPPPPPLDPELQEAINACRAAIDQGYEDWSQDFSGPEPPGLRHDVDGALLTAAAEAYASGATSIPLSPSGCTRLLVRRENGEVVEERLMHGPVETTVDEASLTVIERPTSLSRWTYTASGYEYRGDHDHDGIDEVQLTVTYGASALKEEVEPGTGDVVARVRAVVQPGGETVEVTDERLQAGTLGVHRKYVASLIQPSCNTAEEKPEPPDPTATAAEYTDGVRDCTATETQVLTSRVATALQRGSACLYHAGMPSESDQVIKAVVRKDMGFKCVDKPDGRWIAANDHGFMELNPGKARIVVNSPFFSGSEAFQTGTLAHELFHFFDVHDEDLEAAATEDQLRRSDRVYACEYLCFGAMPTECHMAACQGKKLSTRWMGRSCNGTLTASDKTRIEEARGDGVSIATCDTGQQVGALCRSAQGGALVTFCTTQVECDSECDQRCESQSLSCLPECR